MKKHYKNLILIVLFVFIIGISINVLAAVDVGSGGSAGNTVSCNGVFTQEFIDALKKYIYVPIKWLTPVLLLILTSIDFAQVVLNGKKENMEKAKNNFLKRSLAALIIFFVPNIIELIVSFINNRSITACLNGFK